MAIHEAGHVIARIAHNLGAITLITIDGPDGGFVESDVDHTLVQTEERLAHMIEVYLAGRAAEHLICGEALAGSGGSGTSDLARASALAYALETSLGYSSVAPLLYRDPDDYVAEIRFDPELAARVNARLEAAHMAVTSLIRRHSAAHQILVETLLQSGTLEGRELYEVLAEVKKQIAVPDMGSIRA